MNTHDEIVKKLNDIGFQVKEEYTLDNAYVVLERTVKGHNTHQVILEDHRWERFEKDFDPERDVGDWLIFSYLIDEERDYFGHFVETQYPLTLTEVHLIKEVIEYLEDKNQRLIDEAVARWRNDNDMA